MYTIRAGFQKGDVALTIEERTYRLRLTMGALAEIETRLGVKGPLALAQKIRKFAHKSKDNRESLILLECLLCVSDENNSQVPALIAQANPTLFMPAIAQLFEQNFA